MAPVEKGSIEKEAAMTETKWTPGEWSVQKVAGDFVVRAVYRDDKGRRCTAWPLSATTNPSLDSEANITIAAAAPELYEALEELHERLSRCSQHSISAAEAYDSFYQENTLAALAKARGETHE